MKKMRKLIFILLIIILVPVGAVVASGYRTYREALKQQPLSEAVRELTGIENYTTVEEIPEIYLQAVVATEDRRFYLHGGFDPIGTLRAIITDIKERELKEGGSTITQQLAKNMYFEMDNSLNRKIAEIFMAIKLESEYSKEEILEFYINGIYYGSGYYNVHDAAVGYFDKTPADMTDYECTLLAGIPNAPSVYSLKVNPDLAKKRQEKVVQCMTDVEYISEEEAEEILAGN